MRNVRGNVFGIRKKICRRWEVKLEEAQDIIEKSILAGKQIEIEYTNSSKQTKNYKIATITSTWDKYFKAVVEPAIPDGKNVFKNFRYDRISMVDITSKSYQPGDHLEQFLA